MSLASIRRSLLALLVVGAVAGACTAVTSMVLAGIYRPDAAGWFAHTPTSVRPSAPWSNWHDLANIGFLVSSGGAFAVVLWTLLRSGATADRRHVVPLVGASIVAVGMGVLSTVTKDLVEWDQLALYSVNVGTDLSGYWYAAFGDDIRFVLLGGTEVSQGEYATMLLAHLAAPVLGVVALCAAAAMLVRNRPAQET